MFFNFSSVETTIVTYEHEDHTEDISVTTPAPIRTTSMNEKCSSGAIFTSWFTYEMDPQRDMEVPHTIDYIWNFYITARFLGINIVFFHDHLSPQFVSKFTTDKISFEKVLPMKEYSTNDMRFIVYKEFLEKHPFKWILMADASDVYFNSNPILNYMSQNQKNTSLYLSPDTGSFGSNPWMQYLIERCYPESVESWMYLKVFNAGVWGGHTSAVSCMLNCISNELTKNVKGRGNCNMAVLNWCIYFGECAHKEDLEIDLVKELFVNPFRQECNNLTYSVIHSKCRETAGRFCAIVQNNAIQYITNDVDVQDKSIQYTSKNGKNCLDLVYNYMST